GCPNFLHSRKKPRSRHQATGLDSARSRDSSSPEHYAILSAPVWTTDKESRNPKSTELRRPPNTNALKKLPEFGPPSVRSGLPETPQSRGAFFRNHLQ